MKIRVGFVSNSSSSSFTIYGARFDSEQQCIDVTGEDSWGLASKLGLHNDIGNPDGWKPAVYVGLYISGEIEHGLVGDMKEDETLKRYVEEHRQYEKQLEAYDKRLHLSAEEGLERRRIQKLKLAGRDRIEGILAPAFSW